MFLFIYFFSVFAVHGDGMIEVSQSVRSKGSQFFFSIDKKGFEFCIVAERIELSLTFHN